MTKSFLIALVLGLTAAAPAAAEGFRGIESRNGFVSLVSGKNLTRTGITLSVSPDGRISGRAFGREVRGAWSWDGQFFCRDLSFGRRDLGRNCQVVQVRGDTLRFIADRGAGDFADLRLN